MCDESTGNENNQLPEDPSNCTPDLTQDDLELQKQQELNDTWKKKIQLLDLIKENGDLQAEYEKRTYILPANAPVHTALIYKIKQFFIKTDSTLLKNAAVLIGLISLAGGIITILFNAGYITDAATWNIIIDTLAGIGYKLAAKYDVDFDGITELNEANQISKKSINANFNQEETVSTTEDSASVDNMPTE
jgi:hypothetical protein